MTSTNRQSATLGVEPSATAGALGDDDDAATAAAAVSDTLTRCCLCGSALHEPVPLDCLHDCCAKCLEDDVRRQQQQNSIVGVSVGDVRCPLCDHVSVNVRSDRLNAFVAALVLAERAAAPGDGSVACDLCREYADEEQSAGGGGDDAVPPAAFSCAECGHFLCSDCQRQHSRFASSHAVTPWPPQAAAGGDRSEIARPSGGSGGSGAAASAGRQCAEHRLPVDFYCFRCTALRCSECAIGCARAAAASGAPPHEAARLDDRRSRDHVASVRRRLGNERRRLGEDLAAAADCSLKLSGGGGGGGLAAARSADESALLDRKLLLLAAVEAAYASSADALRARHDGLATDAVNASRRAKTTRRRAERAELYCGAMLDSDDAASLLEQHDRLFTWLGRLQGEAKGALTEIVEVEKRCAAAVATAGAKGIKAPTASPPREPPKDLVTALTTWLGGTNISIAAGGDAEARAARGGRQQLPPPLPLQEQPASRKQPRPLPSGADIDQPTTAGGAEADDNARPSPLQTPSPQRPPARPAPAVVRVGQPSGHFATLLATGGGLEPPTAARSIALTADGHVLVAAGHAGLVEYDSRGRQVSTWRPGRSDSTSLTPEPCSRQLPTSCTDNEDSDDFGAVTLVCALEDGRAGAVVQPTRGVLLLRRHGGSGAFSSASSASWTVENDESPPLGEDLLSAPPSAVAFYGCAVVVAAPEPAGKRCSRSRLALLPLPATSAGGGRRGAAAKAYFEQTIECTVRGAALTPCAAVVSGICGGSGCVVEAYGYGGGAPLWRRELAWHVAAVCTPPSGSVVYVAATGGVGGGGCVVALSGDDGRQLGDVVGGESGAASVALSLRAGVGCAASALAVLSADGKRVTLRPVTGWTIS